LNPKLENAEKVQIRNAANVNITVNSINAATRENKLTILDISNNEFKNGDNNIDIGDTRISDFTNLKELKLGT